MCHSSLHYITLISKNQTWQRKGGDAIYVSPYVITDWGIQGLHFNMLNQLWSSHQTALQRNFHFSQGSKGLHVKDPVCAQICAPGPYSSDDIVALFTTLMPILSLSPIEVIRHALFMFDHSTSESWACLICNSSAGHWRWMRSAWDTQNSLWGLLCNKNQNNDDAKAKLRGMSHIDRAAVRAGNVVTAVLINAIYWQASMCVKKHNASFTQMHSTYE